MDETNITKAHHVSTTVGGAGYRPPTNYERMILGAMQDRPMYQGFGSARLLPAKPGHGPAAGLPARIVEDPRMARVDKWRDRNKAARRSRRLNRLAAQR